MHVGFEAGEMAGLHWTSVLVPEIVAVAEAVREIVGIVAAQRVGLEPRHI